MIKKIVERLEEKIEITWEHDYFGGRKDAFVEAVSIVKEVAKEYNNDWIPCSERLPEISVDVLIATRSLIVGVGSFYGHDRGWLQWYSGGGIRVDVIAWQPLPAPYQKGE